MAQAKKGKLNYRCPMCFARDLDIDMFYDEDKKEYYCIRCYYTGNEEDILRQYKIIKSKYGHIFDRIVNFGDDNKSITYKKFNKGDKL